MTRSRLSEAFPRGRTALVCYAMGGDPTVAATGELSAMWPEAAGLLPRDFGREPDRICVLELERSLAGGAAEVPDAPGELADAVTAIRLATSA